MNSSVSRYCGFTLIELIVTILICGIMISAVSVAMVDSHRGWLDCYAKVHGGAADDAAMSCAAFERIVRKASKSKYILDEEADDLTVYYYQNWQTSTDLDAYSRFYRSESSPQELLLENGRLNPAHVESTVRLSSNVTDLRFRPFDGGVEMILLLNDGQKSITVTTAAILHNE